MSTTLTGAPAFLAKFGCLQSGLPGDSNMRAAAAAAFRTAGLPGGTRRLRSPEAWKYTSLRPLAETQFDTSVVSRHDAEAILSGLALADAPRLVFVDGSFRADLSHSPNVDFARFADRAEMGTLSWPDREPMVALNTMLAGDGACLRVPAGTDAGALQLVSIATCDSDIHPRHHITLDPGARLSLLEVSAGHGAYLVNTVIEIHISAGAHLAHVRFQSEANAAFHISTSYAHVAGGGTYDSFTVNLGSRICRTEVHAELSGSHAVANFDAIQLLNGTQHADFTTVVRHTAPACTSRQIVKNVLSDASRGVSQGRIEVAREAQKTDAYQMNQALLLSPRAEINAKPELEIFADDVKCSHGATVGELDADQIFYLRSRGITESRAREILVQAFLAEAFNVVADHAIRDWLYAKVEARWRQMR